MKPAKRRFVVKKRNDFNVKKPKDSTQRKMKGNGNDEIDEQHLKISNRLFWKNGKHRFYFSCPSPSSDLLSTFIKFQSRSSVIMFDILNVQI